MYISGFQSMTLLDYPGKVACTVFTGGCNFKCPFCHNASIVLNPERQMSEEEIYKHLTKRKDVLDGVCVTGGEPTLMEDLPMFLYRIKEMGLKVKLDTNGYNPTMLGKILDGNLADYVAMDIKHSPHKYKDAVGLDTIDISRVEESIAIIMKESSDYEFRTTLVKGIHCVEDMDGMGEMIKGSKAYFLQSYKESDEIICKVSGKTDRMFETFSNIELNEFLEKAGQYVQNVTLRGV